MTSYMARYGARLADSGYPILPIRPGSKAPGQYRRDQWEGYPEWTKHASRGSKPYEITIWSQWPDAGIGIACGRIIALDIDVLDVDAVAKIEALAERELGDTQAIRIGLAPKKLLVYRTDKPFPSIKRHPLEILGLGAQFVAYADHPDTSKPYAWPYDSLVDMPMSALPLITEDQAKRFLERAAHLVPPELRQSRLGAPRSQEHFGSSSKLGTYEAIEDALAWIPNNDLHYDDWIKIGLAVKTAIGEAGLPLWIGWSTASSKSGKSGKTDTPERTWRSMRRRLDDGALGAGTIYQYARDNGWIPPADMVLDGRLAQQLEEVAEATGGEHPAAGLLASLQSTPASDPPPQAPSQLSDLSFVERAPGLLGDMVRWIVATAVSPQPFLSLGAALAAVGTAMGHRYRLDAPDTRSNVYILALADSGSGKDHPRKCVRRVFMEAGLAAHLGGEQIKSGSGLMVATTEQPVRLYQIDEFGHFIKAALDPKSKAWHLREIMTNFTTLWSSATDTIPGAEYADRKNRPASTIVQPCVSIYGSTVPRTFWDAMSSGAIDDGTLPRILVVQSPEDYPDEQDPAPLELGLQDIVERFRAIAAGVPQTGNLVGHTVAPYTVPMDDGALKADSAIRVENTRLKRKHAGTHFTAIVGRCREHIRRVALIAAVAENPYDPVCTARHVEWAAELVRHCQATVIDQAGRFAADSEHEALLKRVLEVIRKHGPITGNDLARKTQFLKRKDRNDILEQLRESGQIQQLTVTGPDRGPGRPGNVYKCT